MALCRKVVDLVGAQLLHHLQHAHRVAEVGIVEMKPRMSLEVGDTLAKVDRRAADSAVHVISLLQQKLCEKRSVLTGNSGDQSFLHILY